jgi:hypothetical protein
VCFLFKNAILSKKKQKMTDYKSIRSQIDQLEYDLETGDWLPEDIVEMRRDLACLRRICPMTKTEERIKYLQRELRDGDWLPGDIAEMQDEIRYLTLKN